MAERESAPGQELFSFISAGSCLSCKAVCFRRTYHANLVAHSCVPGVRDDIVPTFQPLFSDLLL